MVSKLWVLILCSCLSLLACEEKRGESENATTADRSHEGHGHQDIESYYTCSMHPKVRSDKPGKCPICYMNLSKVEVEKTDLDEVSEREPIKIFWQCKDYPDVVSEVEDVCPIDGTPMIQGMTGPNAGDVIGKIKLKKSQQSHFRPEFFPVSPMKMTKTIRLLGTVTQSEKKESTLPARVAGRVEKVFVESTGSLMKPGDPVLKLYSPKLITAGEEYILARKSVEQGASSEFESLVKQSEERLKQWGVTPRQYKSWFAQAKVPREITIFSNVRGVVRKRNAARGKYFKAGQNFFELSDLSSIWVELDVYEHDSALIKLGQTVSLRFTALPGKVMTGSIDFISPVLDSKSRTLKVRATIENIEGLLMPGMVADATLKVSLEGMPIVVPRSAIIDTGKRKIVWVRIDDQRFQSKLIETGRESEGYVEVVSGLEKGDLVVVEGSFLLDAQAQLFGGYEDFQDSSPATSHQH